MAKRNAILDAKNALDESMPDDFVRLGVDGYDYPNARAFQNGKLGYGCYITSARDSVSLTEEEARKLKAVLAEWFPD